MSLNDLQFRMRCMPIVVHRPNAIITNIVTEKFVKSDWQDFPRKKKKIIKEMMIKVNESMGYK